MKKIITLTLAAFLTIGFTSAFANTSGINMPQKSDIVQHDDETFINNNQGAPVSDNETQPAESTHGEEHAFHMSEDSLKLVWIIPFIGILLSIALFPLVLPDFWHHHYGKVSLFWGLLFVIAFTIENGISVGLFYLLETYLLEFFPFILLLLALFAVAGGIRLKGELAGTPKINALMILIGALLASWMGTTGAAMLMIRPLIRANSWRKYKVHLVVFFIFLVTNIGGALTPLGDPPLFMGFLKGVDFFWTTTHLFAPFCVALVLLLALFFALDTFYYRKETNVPEKNPNGEKLALVGKRNLIIFPIIPIAVLLSSVDMGSAFTIHGVTVTTASLVQMGLLLFATFVSVKITPKQIRVDNDFTWEPILEVAKLFATIFITMVPPIAMLRAGVDGPLGGIVRGLTGPNGEFLNASFFWSTGILSSFLDNAPTYLIFFNIAGGDAAALMTTHAQTLIAISTGAVFMGAITYIGNAPNFMVKSIAESQNIKMPTFFGYMLKYSIPILVPTFIIITLIFF